MKQKKQSLKNNKNGEKTRKRTISPRNRSDITEYQFRDGNPGGPGRPISKPWAEAIKRNSPEPVLNKLAKKLVEESLKGDVQALKEFGDRRDGKVAQPIDHGGRIALDLEGTAKTLEEIFGNK